MSQRVIAEARMAVAGFDWATRRVERFHRLIADFATASRAEGASSENVYEFVRVIGREVGETVSGAAMMADTARQVRAAQQNAISRGT